MKTHQNPAGLEQGGLARHQTLLTVALVLLGACTGDRARLGAAPQCVETELYGASSVEALAAGELRVTWRWKANAGRQEVAAEAVVSPSTGQACAAVAPPSPAMQAAFGASDRITLEYYLYFGPFGLLIDPISVDVVGLQVELSRHPAAGGPREVLGWISPSAAEYHAGALWWLVDAERALKDDLGEDYLSKALVGGSSAFVLAEGLQGVKSPWRPTTFAIDDGLARCGALLDAPGCLGDYGQDDDTSGDYYVDYDAGEVIYLSQVYWSDDVQARVAATAEGAAWSAQVVRSGRLASLPSEQPAAIAEAEAATPDLAPAPSGDGTVRLRCLRARDLHGIALEDTRIVVDTEACVCDIGRRQSVWLVSSASRPDWWPCALDEPEDRAGLFALLMTVANRAGLWERVFPELNPEPIETDGGLGDGGVPDGGLGDGGVPDGGVPDGGVPDGGAPDGGDPRDAGVPGDAG